MSDNQSINFFREVLSNSIVNNIVIDFSGIDFISNSFAKQYIICKQQSKSKRFREINMSSEINCLINTNIQEIGYLVKPKSK